MSALWLQLIYLPPICKIWVSLYTNIHLSYIPLQHHTQGPPRIFAWGPSTEGLWVWLPKYDFCQYGRLRIKDKPFKSVLQNKWRWDRCRINIVDKPIHKRGARDTVKVTGQQQFWSQLGRNATFLVRLIAVPWLFLLCLLFGCEERLWKDCKLKLDIPLV